MKTSIIRSSWMATNGFRLDTNPYLGGALETKFLLEQLPLPKHFIRDLVSPEYGGIYFAGRASVQWVDAREFGIPFLRGKDIQSADLAESPFISRNQVKEYPAFLIKKGMTLITRSGTIGKTAYVRAEMDGMATSDPLRIVPDPQKIPPGYLYAFISSKYGISLVASGASGAIIQHLDPDDIAGIAVPRLGDALEHEIHTLVEQAAELRTKASRLRQAAIRELETTISWKTHGNCLWQTVKSSEVSRRIDAHFHANRSRSGRVALESYSQTESVRSFAAAIYCPDRGARTKVESAEYGVPFLSSSDVFEVAPTAHFMISRDTRDFDRFILSADDVLLPRSGSLGGVIGRAILPIPTNYGQAGSDHLIHIRCKSPNDAHYLWAILASKPGYAAVLATAFGSAIPSLDLQLIGDLHIPILQKPERDSITDSVTQAVQLADRAVKLDQTALGILETALNSHSE